LVTLAPPAARPANPPSRLLRKARTPAGMRKPAPGISRDPAEPRRTRFPDPLPHRERRVIPGVKELRELAARRREGTHLDMAKIYTAEQGTGTPKHSGCFSSVNPLLEFCLSARTKDWPYGASEYNRCGMRCPGDRAGHAAKHPLKWSAIGPSIRPNAGQWVPMTRLADHHWFRGVRGRRLMREASARTARPERRDALDPWLRLPRGLRVSLRRARIACDPVFGRLTSQSEDAAPQPWTSWLLQRLPLLPTSLRRVRPPRVWDAPLGAAPAGLRTVAGIWRDPELEAEAFRERPLHNYYLVHYENVQRLMRHNWHCVLPALPRMARVQARASGLRGAHRALHDGPPKVNGSEGKRVAKSGAGSLTASEVRAEAVRLGISAVGFTAYDPKYTLAEYAGRHDEGSVIVCLFEQDWAATQTAPSARCERAAFSAYTFLGERVVALAEFVEQRGHRAYPHSFQGETIMIQYGVQTGLGQLGLNGQLLTPQAGSRARLSIITTDAEFEHDQPVDFGIHRICDECQACVRRCPVGAIPRLRREYRGVRKAKIKTERCFPVAANAEGCAICMKVCPIQRYGLDAVKRHYVDTGEILGRGSDELEGYTWPVDGRHYPPGEKPDADAIRRVLNPPHWHPVDPERLTPRLPSPSGTKV
jgi:epoxyqueuosine reductase